jgi:hypothetical protein
MSAQLNTRVELNPSGHHRLWGFRCHEYGSGSSGCEGLGRTRDGEGNGGGIMGGLGLHESVESRGELRLLLRQLTNVVPQRFNLTLEPLLPRHALPNRYIQDIDIALKRKLRAVGGCLGWASY